MRTCSAVASCDSAVAVVVECLGSQRIVFSGEKLLSWQRSVLVRLEGSWL